MSGVSDNLYDNGLNYAVTNADQVVILSGDPGVVYANIATYLLGTKTSPTVGSPADRDGGGREVTVSSFTDGNVSASGEATHFALLYNANSEVLASMALGEPFEVVQNSSFSLSAFAVYLNDPA